MARRGSRKGIDWFKVIVLMVIISIVLAVLGFVAWGVIVINVMVGYAQGGG